MVRSFILSFFIFTGGVVQSQTTFQKVYRSANSKNAQANSIQQTSDGGYIIAGADSSSATLNYDFHLVKTDANGDTLWTRIYGTSNNEYAQTVQQTTDGGYVLAGSVNNAGGNWDIYVVKTNSTGDTLWTKQYSEAGDDEAYSIRQTSDGGYIIGGYTSSFGSYDYYLIKTNASGVLTWAKTYGSTIDDLGYSVQQTNDGGYIITGATDGYTSSIDILLVKTDLNGDTLWTKLYGTTGIDWTYEVKQTADGGYILVGYTNQDVLGTTTDIYLIKTDNAGDTLWTQSYGGSNDEQGLSVAQTNDGGYVVTGNTSSYGAGGGDVILLKVSSAGNVLFSQPFGDAGSDEGFSIMQTSDKGFVIAGVQNNLLMNGLSTFYLVKTDSLGKDSCNTVGFTIGVINPVTTVSGAGLVKQIVTPIVNGVQTNVISSCLVNAILCPQTTAVSSLKNNSSVSVYPNPGNGIFNLNYENGNLQNAKITVTNVLGEAVYHADSFTGEQVNISFLPRGTYLLQLQMQNKIFREKIIIVKN